MRHARQCVCRMHAREQTFTASNTTREHEERACSPRDCAPTRKASLRVGAVQSFLRLAIPARAISSDCTRSARDASSSNVACALHVRCSYGSVTQENPMAQQGYGREEWLTTSRGGEDEHEYDRDSQRAPYYETDGERRRSYSSGDGAFARDSDRSRQESWRGSGDRYSDNAWSGESSRRREPESYGSEGGSSRGSWGYRGRDYGGELDEGRYSSAPGTARSSFDDFRERGRDNDRHDDRYRGARGYDDDRGDRSRGAYESAAFEPRGEYPDSRDRFREDDRNRFRDDEWRWRHRPQDTDSPGEIGRRSRYEDESGPSWDYDRSRSRR
jgi:hypothetical protein